MRRATIVGMLALSACSVSPFTVGPFAGRDKQVDSAAWTDCVNQAAAHFDDGKSDPASIAQNVQRHCAPLYQRLTQTVLREQYTSAGRADTAALMKDNELKQITAAVLTSRASGH